MTCPPPPEFQKDTGVNRNRTMLRVKCLSEKEVAFSEVTSNSLTRSQLEFSSCASQMRGLASHHIKHATHCVVAFQFLIKS